MAIFESQLNFYSIYFSGSRAYLFHKKAYENVYKDINSHFITHTVIFSFCIITSRHPQQPHTCKCVTICFYFDKVRVNTMYIIFVWYITMCKINDINTYVKRRQRIGWNLIGNLIDIVLQIRLILIGSVFAVN